MASERRPDDSDYYESRLELFSQGISSATFRWPTRFPPMRSSRRKARGTRRFLSGPFEVGLAMLVTPTCSMRAQGAPDRYAHPVRSLVPLRPFEEFVGAGLLDDSRAGLARKRDGLINYMYLPASEELAEALEGQRVTQLAVEGARQLQSKLVWFVSSLKLDRATFEPPLD